MRTVASSRAGRWATAPERAASTGAGSTRRYSDGRSSAISTAGKQPRCAGSQGAAQLEIGAASSAGSPRLFVVRRRLSLAVSLGTRRDTQRFAAPGAAERLRTGTAGAGRRPRAFQAPHALLDHWPGLSGHLRAGHAATAHPGGREAIINVPGAGDNRTVPQLVNLSQSLAHEGIVVV